MLRSVLPLGVFALAQTLGGCTAPREEPPPPVVVAAPAVARATAEPDCEVTVEGPATANVGDQHRATVSLRPTGRFEVNQEAPMAVRVSSSTLALADKELGLDDAVVLAPTEVTMSIPFSAEAPGEHTLEVHAHFGLCDGESCSLCRKAASLTTRVN